MAGDLLEAGRRSKQEGMGAGPYLGHRLGRFASRNAPPSRMGDGRIIVLIVAVVTAPVQENYFPFAGFA
jgi:hypothetical protein